MPIARTATTADLQSLLDLFNVSELGSIVEPFERAEQVWRRLLDQGNVTVFVSETDDRIVATCMLIVVPNLLQSMNAFLENVITHPSFKGQGHTRAVVEAALSQAWAMNCYQVLHQRGPSDPRLHRFYERCGFELGLDTAYVARRPTKGARPLLTYARP